MYLGFYENYEICCEVKSARGWHPPICAAHGSNSNTNDKQSKIGADHGKAHSRRRGQVVSIFSLYRGVSLRRGPERFAYS